MNTFTVTHTPEQLDALRSAIDTLTAIARQDAWRVEDVEPMIDAAMDSLKTFQRGVWLAEAEQAKDELARERSDCGPDHG